MKILYCTFGWPHLLNRTIRATLYHAPAVEVMTPEGEKYVDSQSVHALGIIQSEAVIVIGAGSRDRAAQIALERLGRVEPCQVVSEARAIGRKVIALPGDVVIYGDSIG